MKLKTPKMKGIFGKGNNTSFSACMCLNKSDFYLGGTGVAEFL